MDNESTVYLTRVLQTPHNEVVVEIHFPARVSQGDFDTYSCLIVIRGLPDEPEVQIPAAGVDEVQAMIIALSMVGDRLGSSGLSFSFSGTSGHGFFSTEVATTDLWKSSIEVKLSPTVDETF